MKNTYVIGAIIVLVLAGLFAWGNKNSAGLVTYFRDTDIECLRDGHVNLGQHIHSRVTVIVDGEQVMIPANVGNTPTCMAELHMHDATGEIHLETVDPNKTFGIADFFTVWDQPFEREGYERVVTVNGEEIDPTTYEMKDLDRIVVTYTSTGGFNTEMEIGVEL